ncbi:MAG: hypothetical protein JWR84_3530 [Caulobacter sp.]|nr:hypothetical protein [Caulobacter sp.]
MTFQTVFLIGVVLAFGSLFVTLMGVWIYTNLPVRKPIPFPPRSIAARRPESFKRAA